MAKSYKGIGKGRYKALKGPRKGKTFTIGKSGAHVYAGKKGTKVVIRKGGKREVIRPKKVDPYKAEVDAAVKLEFGEADDQLAKERRTSVQMSRNVGDWWDGYKADVERARQTTAGGYQQAQQGVYNQANTARAQDASKASEMDAEAQKAAALRGTTAGPNVAAQAQASRNAQSNSFGGLVGAQGAAQNSYMADQGRIGGGIRALELGKEAGRGRLVEEEQRKSNARKGAYRVTKRQELVDAKYKRRLEAAAFGLDVAKADSTAADKAADNRRQAKKDRQDKRDKAAGRGVTKRGQNITKRGQNLTEADRQWKRDHPTKAKGKKGTARRKAGYGATNVSVPVAVTNRKQWEDLVADSKRIDRVPKKAKGLMRTVLVEYAGGRGKVSKKTALKVFRVYGFRLPYTKNKRVGRGNKKAKGKVGNW